MTTLVALVQRAATISAPFNTQDAVLLIRALGALHLARPEVRTVAEKASFSLASAPAEVPTAVLIDAVHHLTALQSTQLPVVQRVLLKRFCELPLTSPSPSSSTSSASQPPPDPRTVQKAALTLAKMGRDGGHAEATEHVLRLVHVALTQRPDDVGLHLGYVALYANSARYRAQPQWWQTPAAQRKLSTQTLQRSLAYLLRHPAICQRTVGNVAWQLLHLLVVLPPPAAGGSSDATAPALSSDDVRRYEACVCTDAFAQRVSGGAYVRFVHAFAADLCRLDLRRFIGVLRPLTGWVAAATAGGEAAHAEVAKRLNVYDQTKLAGALADALQALASHPARPPTAALAPRGTGIEAEVEGLVGSVTLESHSQQEWAAALQLSCSLLHHLVALAVKGVSRAPADAAHSLETIAHPDPFLVAALLNAFAVLTTVVLDSTPRGASDVAALLPDACVAALTELVLLLSGGPPSLISWTLHSLAALRRWVAADLVPALERGADVLLRRYCSTPSTQRSMRADVQVVYAYACLTDEGDRAAARNLVNTSEKADANLVRGTSAAPSGLPPDAALLALSTLDPVLRSLAPRLHRGGAGANRATVADADMLLAALCRLFAADTVPVVSPPLDGLVASLAAHFANNVEAAAWRAESPRDKVLVRAARLQVLVARLADAHLLRPATATALTAAAEAALREVSVWVAAATPGDESKVNSATMLHLLDVLVQRPPRRARGSPSSSPMTPSAAEGSAAGPLLSVACAAYQRHVSDVAATCGAADARLSRVVHVLWRARQAGVQIYFTDDGGAEADSGATLDVDHEHWGGGVPAPRLCFPLRACRAALLSGTAAADLLRLLAESHLSATGSSTASAAPRLPPHVLPQLRNELLDRLQVSVDVAGVILLVQLNDTFAVSQLVFPDKVGLHRLMRCVEETAGSLVLAAAREAAEDDARRNRPGGPLAAVRRLLYALVGSQLLLRLSSVDEVEQGRLLSALRLLAQQVEDSARPADVVAVMKARLLSSGVL